MRHEDINDFAIQEIEEMKKRKNLEEPGPLDLLTEDAEEKGD